MFSLDVVDTDNFLDMPASTQALYFHLGMNADDDGFVSSPRKITTIVNCSNDDLKLLITKGYVIPFASGIVVITHWKLNNTIQSDRYHKTTHTQELTLLQQKDGVYILDTSCIQNVSELDTQIRLDKTSIDKIRLDKTSIGENRLGEDSAEKGECERKKTDSPFSSVADEEAESRKEELIRAALNYSYRETERREPSERTENA